MKHLSLFFLLITAFCTTMAQKQDNVWVFGNAAGLDFNSGSPVPIKTSISTIEGSASICDTNGQLLFYTEGSTVWDKNGNVMPNGSNITGLGPTMWGYSPSASTTQSSLIVPVPGSYTRFYLFTLTDGSLLGIHDLYYSIVDMSLNGGMGDVVAAQKGIVLDSMLSEKLTGTIGKHCNLWVVVNRSNGNFHAFEITDAGLNTTPVISPSGINSGLTYNYGEIKFASTGDKMVAGSQSFFGLKLYDFDGYTGVFSNIRTINHRDVYGLCFSPDNSKIYAASADDTLYQYDATQQNATDIENSEISISPTVGLTIIKRAINDKLYFWGALGLGVINHPNLQGADCDTQLNVVNFLAGTSPEIGGLSNDVSVLRHDTAAYKRDNITQCFKDSITLQAADSGFDYTWQNGATGQTFFADTSGTYFVQYKTPACTFHSDTFAVNLFTSLPVTGSYSGCFGNYGAYLFINPASGDVFSYTYTWHNSNDSVLQQHTSVMGDTLRNILPGDYSVTVSGNVCDTTLHLTLHPAQNIVLAFNVDTVICAGDVDTFSNTSNGFASYLWLFGDGDTSTTVSPQHIYTQAGNYQVSLIGLPCVDTTKIYVRVDSPARVSFETDKDFYCSGEPVLFTSSYSYGVLDIAWSFGDGSTESNLQPIHPYDRSGDFVVTATAATQACNSAAFTDTIHVYPFPVVDIGPDTSICPGQPLSLKLFNLATQDQVTDYTYYWSTGDTTAAIVADTVGTYWLTATSSKGCKTTDTMEINPNCYMDIPNAFTPNGDGINDYFFPRQMLSDGLVTFKMEIYNRWGELVFTTTNTDGRGWDGKFNGVTQPEGVFIYIVDATFKNGQSEHHQGNVTLLR